MPDPIEDPPPYDAEGLKGRVLALPFGVQRHFQLEGRRVGQTLQPLFSTRRIFVDGRRRPGKLVVKALVKAVCVLVKASSAG